MMKTALILFTMTASPLAAQQFSLPQGCEAYLTVQTVSCTVTHYFRCEDDTDGAQRRASLDEDGLAYVGRISNEAEWLESFHLRSAHTERLMSAADPMSMTELLGNSIDTFDFITESREIGDSHYVGFDSLTGESVDIDGVTLLRTQYQVKAYDAAGTEKWNSQGSEYVSSEWRMFFGGISTYNNGTESYENDDTPAEFIFPDEPGYLSVNPKFGCGVDMSAIDAPSHPILIND